MSIYGDSDVSDEGLLIRHAKRLPSLYSVQQETVCDLLHIHVLLIRPKAGGNCLYSHDSGRRRTA